jgi:S1-C subfamily serine protease
MNRRGGFGASSSSTAAELVVTNYHVIEGAELGNIQVVIEDLAYRRN